MFRHVAVLAFAAVLTNCANDPATDQLVNYKRNFTGPIRLLTTSAGAPVEYEDATSTRNANLLNNEFFMDVMTHFVRERIPERVVHAKGAGAFGYFETTHDISHICKAKLFSQVGKRTKVAVRFSLALKSKGSLDTSVDARGYSLKFYTEEGNFDIPGFNTPMYVYKDPLKFLSFVHSFKPNPATNLLDRNAIWDFLSLNPESMHMFLLIFSDRGIPDGYRHMPGFGIHTYQVVNKKGESYFIRFHFLPNAGIKNLSVQQAGKIAAMDPDYATRDLYVAIGSGNYPSWQVSVQILSLTDVIHAGFDVFDSTKVLPLKRYPLHPVGHIVLDKNPLNYFADVEQMAFCPGNLVPGILGSPDKLFQSRRLAYRDAQNYRLGINFNKIPVNCPFQTQAFTYNRDGVPPVDDNGNGGPNYYPNSFYGPEPYVDKKKVSLLEIYHDDPNNFEQAGDLYANGLTAGERKNLVVNIVANLRHVEYSVKYRSIAMLKLIHPDLGHRVVKGLAANETLSGKE